MILAADPDISKVGLLYDAGQDASTTAIKDAKAFFEACKPVLEKDRDAFKTGIKNDYEYAIAYAQTANRAGNCDYLMGAYLRGNSVILITGTSPQGLPDSFCDYIFEKIGVIDPNTLKKK